MSYTKQTWANGDVITADKLNHIEDGIDGINNRIRVIYTATWDDNTNDYIWTCDKTFNEILSLIESGVDVYAQINRYGEVSSAIYNLIYVYSDELCWMSTSLQDYDLNPLLTKIFYDSINHYSSSDEDTITGSFNSTFANKDEYIYPIILSYNHNTSALTGASFDICKNSYERGVKVAFIDAINGSNSHCYQVTSCEYDSSNQKQELVFATIDMTGEILIKKFYRGSDNTLIEVQS